MEDASEACAYLGCLFIKLFSVLIFFFFSSRRRHTRFDCDWSSDVCSADLDGRALAADDLVAALDRHLRVRAVILQADAEEITSRRVGKVCRSRKSPYHSKKKKAIRKRDDNVL